MGFFSPVVKGQPPAAHRAVQRRPASSHRSIWAPFCSRSSYRELAERGRGAGLLYLVGLLVLSALPLLVPISSVSSRVITAFEAQLLPKIARLEIRDGRMSVTPEAGEQLYDQPGPVLVTLGERSRYEQVRALAVLGRADLSVKIFDAWRVLPLEGFGDQSLDRAELAKALADLQQLLPMLIFIAVLLPRMLTWFVVYLGAALVLWAGSAVLGGAGSAAAAFRQASRAVAPALLISSLAGAAGSLLSPAHPFCVLALLYGLAIALSAHPRFAADAESGAARTASRRPRLGSLRARMSAPLRSARPAGGSGAAEALPVVFRDALLALKRLVAAPAAFWQAAREQNVQPEAIFYRTILPLAAFPAFTALFRAAINQGSDIETGFRMGIIAYALAVAVPLAAALVMMIVAKSIVGQSDLIRALQLAAYPVGVWCVGSLLFIIGLSPRSLFLKAYCVYLAAAGAAVMLGVPRERMAAFILWSVGGTFVASAFMAAVLSAIFG